MQLNSTLNALAIPVRLLIIVGVLTLLVFSFYDIFSPNTPTNTEDPQSLAPRDMVSAQDITRAKLFGSADEPPSFDIEQIAETTLNLTLIGIVYDEDDPENSWARIAQGTQRSKRYETGDRIAGVANLEEIRRDRVILMRTGQRELLAFAKSNEIFELVEGTMPPPTREAPPGYIEQRDLDENDALEYNPSDLDGGLEPNNSMELDEGSASIGEQADKSYEAIKDALETDPDGVLEELGIAQVSDSGAEGYRINADLATTFGLRKGDIVKSINGKEVGDIEEDLAAFIKNMDSPSANLSVQRGDEILKLEIQLDQ